LLQRLLPIAALEAWGWRIPFVLGALFALVALVMRTRLAESDAFVAARAVDPPAGRMSGVAALKLHRRAVATVVGLTAGGTVAFYTFTTYAQKFLVNTAGFTKEAATMTSAASLLLFMCLQPLVGALSDKVGRRPVLMTFAVLGTFGTIPLMRALAQAQSTAQAFLLLSLALIAVSGYTSINAVVKAELFPTGVRALGVGFPYAVAVSLFGGTAEYIALWCKNIGHEEWFYWYVSACAFGGLIVYWTMPETKGRISG
jgi:MHS family alpha-ketoglutarate permease-like MFS transporter